MIAKMMGRLLLFLILNCLLHQSQSFQCGITSSTRYFTRPLPTRSQDAHSDLQSQTFEATDQETETEIEFPSALSKVDRLKRAAKFWGTAVPIILSYYSKSVELEFRNNLLGDTISEDEEKIVWEQTHSKGALKLADTITSLKGFYVKTAQIIASRRDLFPKEYTMALSNFTDNVDPLPASLTKAVITRELLNRGEKFEDVFIEFDEEPLGAASIAQVHRAVLSPKYGGPKEVAVKVQRPSIESKLMGDIANLIAITKPLKENEMLPLDYHTVFLELEKQLADEFDFVAEAAAMERIYAQISADGEPPLTLPRPVSGLVCRRVLVMDYLRGIPLSRAGEEMLRKGIDPESPEALLFGRKLLKSLTAAFGKSILEYGFFHADPHPGNIMVLEDGSIGLIDFGQVKQISGRARQTLSKVMIALDERKSDTNPEDLETIGNLALELGVEFKEEGVKEEAPAAVAMWLFDGTVSELPGGYDVGELSPNSPVKELKSFPQDLVLVGRSSILIKGLSNRLGIPWSLASEWAPYARSGTAEGNRTNLYKKKKVRFRDVVNLLYTWSKGKTSRFVMRFPWLRTRAASLSLRVQEWHDKRNR